MSEIHAITREKYIEFIGVMLDIDERSQQFSVGRAKADKFIVLHPLVAHTISMSRSALDLIDCKKYLAAMALSRIAFEHAVIAQYAHLQSDGLRGLRAKSYSDYKLNLEAAKEVYSLPKAIIDSFEEVPSQYRPNELRNFRNTCSLFGEAKALYAIYVFMSASMHPGNKVQNAYLHYEADEQILPTASLREGVLESDEAILHTLLVSLLLSQFVYEDIRKTKPFVSKIRNISKQSGIPCELTLLNGTNP